MAVRKLSSLLFSAKPGASQSDRSALCFHFIASIRRERNRYAFVCEGQPLMTFESHGLPDRCPACGALNPLTGE